QDHGGPRPRRLRELRRRRSGVPDGRQAAARQGGRGGLLATLLHRRQGTVLLEAGSRPGARLGHARLLDRPGVRPAGQAIRPLLLDLAPRAFGLVAHRVRRRLQLEVRLAAYAAVELAPQRAVVLMIEGKAYRRLAAGTSARLRSHASAL